MGAAGPPSGWQGREVELHGRVLLVEIAPLIRADEVSVLPLRISAVDDGPAPPTLDIAHFWARSSPPLWEAQLFRDGKPISRAADAKPVAVRDVLVVCPTFDPVGADAVTVFLPGAGFVDVAVRTLGQCDGIDLSGIDLDGIR